MTGKRPSVRRYIRRIAARIPDAGQRRMIAGPLRWRAEDEPGPRRGERLSDYLGSTRRRHMSQRGAGRGLQAMLAQLANARQSTGARRGDRAATAAYRAARRSYRADRERAWAQMTMPEPRRHALVRQAAPASGSLLTTTPTLDRVHTAAADAQRPAPHARADEHAPAPPAPLAPPAAAPDAPRAPAAA